MLETYIISAITVLLSGCMTYVIIKKSISPDVILDYLDISLDEITNNTEMQKKVYVLGVLLGNGIRAGVGLQKGKGKFKLEDVIGMALGQIFGNMGQKQGQTQNPVDDQNPFNLPL